MPKTAIDKLDAEIKKIMDEYAEDVTNGVSIATELVGKAGVKSLRSLSKSTFKGSGEYAKGWKSNTERQRTGTKVTLYNSNPGLPHLLENGHAKRGGGRVQGRKHIEPVEKEIIEKFTKAVMEAAK